MRYSCGDIVTVKKNFGDQRSNKELLYPRFYIHEKFVVGDHWIIEHITRITSQSTIASIDEGYYKLVHMSGLKQMLVMSDEMDWYFEPKAE
jgi:hypothetical protein